MPNIEDVPQSELRKGAGLAVGKFYPLHKGHLHLINTMIENSYRSTVIVMASSFESISLEDRVRWVKESITSKGHVEVIGIIDDAPVDYTSDSAWDSHVALMVNALLVHRIPARDYLYSSEKYGDRLALSFPEPMVHINVDEKRRVVPISGTKVRPDLNSNWKYLPDSVRNDLSVKIAVVGAESTGTTTLAEGLRDHYSSRFSGIYPVKEYGREYTYMLYNDLESVRSSSGLETSVSDIVWTEDDFRNIYNRQGGLQNIANLVSPLAIYDTDQLATLHWYRYYTGSNFGLSGVKEQLVPDIYLITSDVGIPYEDDGWRDNDYEARRRMTENFMLDLTRRGLPWVLISGNSRSDRLEMSTKVIDAIINKKHTFSSPAWADVTKMD